MSKNTNKNKKFLSKILKFYCPDCETSFQLIETHSLKKEDNCGQCPAQWKEILQRYHQEQCWAYWGEENNKEKK